MDVMEAADNQPDPCHGFGQAATRLWAAYLEVGPSRVAPELLDTLVSAYTSLTESRCLSPELALNAERLVELSRWAVLRTEGLCFVTGEAGLVPRRDLHAEFEQLLAAWVRPPGG